MIMQSFRGLQRHAMQQLGTQHLTLRTHSAVKLQQYHSQQLLRVSGQRNVSQVARSREYHHHQNPSRLVFTSSRGAATLPRSRTLPSSFIRPFRRSARYYATAAPVSEANLTLSQRLKKLSREYGWSALGVYLLISALDFPLCFLAVRLLGTDRIGRWEHVIVTYVKQWIAVVWPQGVEVVDGAEKGGKRILEEGIHKIESVTQSEEQGKRILEEGKELGIEEDSFQDAVEANKRDNASLWTQLALAYALHKSLIFVKVPLTAAVTPKVVKTLRAWGWNIGKRPIKKTASSNTGSGAGSSASGTGVNTKGTGVKND